MEKVGFYRTLQQKLSVLIAGESDWLANLANGAALLFNELEDVNWAGFYLRKGDELVLGPFQGKPACIRIPLGKGVCGTAADKNQTLLVPNVHEFPDHIACDPNSLSEIVVPLALFGKVRGVLDIDSPLLGRFDETDKAGLEDFVSLLVSGTIWD